MNESIDYDSIDYDSIQDVLENMSIQEVVINTGGLLLTKLSLDTQCVRDTNLTLREYVQHFPNEFFWPFFIKYYDLDIEVTPSPNCSFPEQNFWNDSVQYLFDEGKLTWFSEKSPTKNTIENYPF
jgi:hypothetical protein